MALYHSEIYLPENVKNFFGRKFNLNYSNHARTSCINDKYGIINRPPFSVEVTKENIIEVETDENKVIKKIVIRIKYDEKYDLILVFIPDFDRGLVKTVWKNSIQDGHSTLRKELYKKD